LGFGQRVLAAVVKGLGVRGHVLFVVQRDRIEIADGERDRVFLPIDRFDLRVFRRGAALANRLQEFVEDLVMPVQEDRLGFEAHRLLPQRIHGLSLLSDAPFEFRSDIFRRRRLRLRDRQGVGKRLI